MSLVSKIQEINNSIQKNATAIQNGKSPTETVDLSGMLSEAGNVANSVATKQIIFVSLIIVLINSK